MDHSSAGITLWEPGAVRNEYIRTALQVLVLCRLTRADSIVVLLLIHSRTYMPFPEE